MLFSPILASLREIFFRLLCASWREKKSPPGGAGRDRYDKLRTSFPASAAIPVYREPANRLGVSTV
jgi:hypothetical protein